MLRDKETPTFAPAVIVSSDMAKKAKTSAPHTIRIQTADGNLTMQVEVPLGPTRLADMVPLAQRITEAQGERAVAVEKKEGRLVSCKTGCAACCRQLVPISAPEAFHLADHVIGLPGDVRDEYLARIDSVETTIEATGLMVELDALTSGGPLGDAGSLAARYFGEQIACPFLKDEKCGVYSQRPLCCRDYRVTSPAEFCSKPGLNRLRLVPTGMSLSMPLSRAAATLVGGDPLMIPLSVSMRWVESHADWGFQEWPGPEVMRALLRELGVPEVDLTKI